ncbi:MAG: hypothetical protein GTN69_12325 [Armatimonadetes bacterium]|nr:hypothetical protein [Armatimonadota bacterium]
MHDFNRLDHLQGGSEAKANLNRAITDAIRRSFDRCGMRNPTNAEITDRARFCVDKALELYNDLGWTVVKVAGHIETALQCHLAGIDWQPEQVGDFWRVQE